MTNHTVLVGISDLLFLSKVRGGLEAQGCNVRVATKIPTLIEEGLAHKPSLLIFDLGLESLDPALLLKELRQNEALRDLPVLGFTNHVQIPKWEDQLKDPRLKVVSNGFISGRISDMVGLLDLF